MLHPHRKPGRGAPSRFNRLTLEQLEQRRCLTAELDFVITSNLFGSNDVYDAIEVDAAGNFYVSSNSQVIKYSPQQTVQWTANLPNAYEMALDADGNVYATGVLKGQITIPGVSGNVVLSYPGNDETFLVKFNNSGQALWARVFGGTGAIAVDPQGNVLVGSGFAGTATIGGNTFIPPDSFFDRSLAAMA